jgi:hypothetical protein
MTQDHKGPDPLDWDQLERYVVDRIRALASIDRSAHATLDAHRWAFVRADLLMPRLQRLMEFCEATDEITQGHDDDLSILAQSLANVRSTKGEP